MNRLIGTPVYSGEKKKPRAQGTNEALAKKEREKTFRNHVVVLKWLPAGAPKQPFTGTPRFPRWFYEGVFDRAFQRIKNLLPREVTRLDLARCYTILSSRVRTRHNAERDETFPSWLMVSADILVATFLKVFEGVVGGLGERRGRILDMYGFMKEYLTNDRAVVLSDILGFEVVRPRCFDRLVMIPKSSDRVIAAVRRAGDEEPVKMVFDADEFRNFGDLTHKLPRDLTKRGEPKTSPLIGRSLRGGMQPVVAGNKPRRAVLNNRGTGGKSKQAITPQQHTKPKHTGKGSATGQGANKTDKKVDAENQKEEDEERKFFYSSDCKQRKLHEMDVNVNGVGFYDFDCYGSPYCGFVCIDVAVGGAARLKEYKAIVGQGNPLDFGNEKWLSQYASKRGVNICIWIEDQKNPGKWEVYYKNLNSYAWKTVHLAYKIVGHETSTSGLILDIGHYTLFVENVSDLPPFNIPPLAIEKHTVYTEGPVVFLQMCCMLVSMAWSVFLTVIAICGGWLEYLEKVEIKKMEYLEQILKNENYSMHFKNLASFVLPLPITFYIFTFFGMYVRSRMLRLRMTERWTKMDSFLNRSNADKRSITDRRDRMNYQELYVKFRAKRWFDFEGPADLVDLLTWGLFWQSVQLMVWLLKTPYSVACKLARREDPFHEREIIISAVRFVEGYTKAQECLTLGVDPSKALSTVFSKRDVNTDVMVPNVLNDTCFLLKEEIQLLPKCTRESELDLVIYNANSADSLIDKKDRILEAQKKGMLRGGGCNYIKRFVLKDPKKKILSDAPIGAPLSYSGILGCGQLNLTDSPGLLAAFCGRSMTAGKSLAPKVQEFLEFCYDFLEKHIMSVDVHGLEEPDIFDYFPKLYQGKKTQVYINNVMRKYRMHLDNELPEGDKFYNCSAFVKMESNAKFENGDKSGRLRTKPRLIMTMSDEMLCELCPSMILIDRWNHGSFSQYQIKDLPVEEVIDRIIYMSDRAHNVTDYSSFESSITRAIRRLENYVLLRLAARARFERLYRKILVFYDEGRDLKTKFGSFYIESRCSGDFVTSFGNGIVNVCLSAYSAFKNGLPFMMIAEGDDGLIPSEISNPEVLKELGFSLSEDLQGSRPGDCDFLRSRWVDGKRYLNICRMMRVFWVRNAHELKRSKRMYLLRASANSLYHLSPGHPVLTAVVNRIWRMTAGFNDFKNSKNYLEKWYNLNFQDSGYKRVEVDESMRAEIAAGAQGFPAISVANQIVLEKSLEFEEHMFVGELLDEYEDFESYTKSYSQQDDEDYQFSEDFLSFVRSLQDKGTNLTIASNRAIC